MKSKALKVIVVVLLIAIILGLLVFMYFKTDIVKKKKTKDEEVVEYLDVIKGYDYQLEERDIDLYKEKFKELKKVLSDEEIDYSSYASLISQLYIIDLYTINNKTSLYDVGASEFVYPSIRDNYELRVRDTLYRYVEDNTNGKRTQKLPEVLDVEVLESVESTYQLSGENKDGYTVKLRWEYVEDLGYDSEATIKLVREENKLYIVEQE